MPDKESINTVSIRGADYNVLSEYCRLKANILSEHAIDPESRLTGREREARIRDSMRFEMRAQTYEICATLARIYDLTYAGRERHVNE